MNDTFIAKGTLLRDIGIVLKNTGPDESCRTVCEMLLHYIERFPAFDIFIEPGWQDADSVLPDDPWSVWVLVLIKDHKNPRLCLLRGVYDGMFGWTFLAGSGDDRKIILADDDCHVIRWRPMD